MLTINIQFINNVAKNDLLPKYATKHSAGLDLCANIEMDIILKAHDIVMVSTGIAISLPDGYEGQIRPRSGLAAKNVVTVLNTPGTIDADYRGEIKVILINHSDTDFIISPGMRIAQLVISRYEKIDWNIVESLEISERGMGGFGSTGVN